MNDKERIRIRQMRAEANNLSRKIKHFERIGGSAPVTLFERKAVLEQKLQSKIWLTHR